jgi:hypothetical protein
MATTRFVASPTTMNAAQNDIPGAKEVESLFEKYTCPMLAVDIHTVESEQP